MEPMIPVREKSKAVVLLSGGQDSTTALAWALEQFDEVVCLSFVYGQRHEAELSAAIQIADELAGCEHHTLDLSVLGEVTAEASGLTGEQEIKETDDLPTSFVPGRNILMITLAVSWAYAHFGKDSHIRIVCGVSQEDYSGYPDCREETIQSLGETLRLGMEVKLSLYTPLMHISKAESIRMMDGMNKLYWLGHTMTCYEGQSPPCGQCLSCKLRAKGFAEAGFIDPLLADESDEPEEDDEEESDWLEDSIKRDAERFDSTEDHGEGTKEQHSETNND